MELCWRYLGSSIAGSAGSSWVMWGARRGAVGYVVPGESVLPQHNDGFDAILGPCWTHHEVHFNRFGAMLKN